MKKDEISNISSESSLKDEINVPNPSRMKKIKTWIGSCGRNGAQGLYSKMYFPPSSFDGGEGERELKSHCDLN